MKRHFEESIALQKAVMEDDALLGALKASVEVITDCLRKGKKLLIAGNGGSAADAQHFSAELVGRYLKDRKAFPALALTVDTSILTAWSNDHSYDDVFSRQVEAYGDEGDVFIGISTSGNSRNLIEASKVAKRTGIESICLLGKGGGPLKDVCDRPIIVPSDSTPHIQEVHGMLIHIICEEVENALS